MLNSGFVSGKASQLAKKLILLKGTGFSPYINQAKSSWALAPEASLQRKHGGFSP
jgi:hypothetical protein